MHCRRIPETVNRLVAFLAVLALISCNATKNIKEGEHLLRSNSVKLKSKLPLGQKTELSDNVSKLTAQKTNTYFLDYRPLGVGIGTPFRLHLYNFRYKKYLKDPLNYRIKQKSVEAPVIYDSTLKRKTAVNMKSYLFNKGFFYANITDTTRYRNKKAFVTYIIEPGKNYKINNIIYDVDDSATLSLVTLAHNETALENGIPFSYDLLDKEKTRITNLLRDWGYWRFTNDNISFVLDTVAGNTSNLQENSQKSKIDIRMIVRSEDSTRNIYRRYGIASITVYPDFKSPRDFKDSAMIEKTYYGVKFRYHKFNVRAKVILNHMVIAIGRYFSQTEHDLTISKLNDLGIFQSVNISYIPDGESDWLKCAVVLTPNDKYDFSTSWELSNGTTYLAGTNLTLSFRNKNLGKGANLLTTSLTGGVESYYDTSIKNIELLSKSIGFNTSLEFPKFLFPISQEKISSLNAPRTVISAGVSLLDRINYFTLYNFATSFGYRWRETRTKNWEVSPVFINKVELEKTSTTFDAILSTNQLLKNTYASTFIEGENIAFTFSDKEKKRGQNYTYLKLGVEEAGGLMKGINLLFSSLDSTYSQYVKFDLDAQHFFTRRRSAVAMRFQAGIGIPYGHSQTLPYIKQYFVGGAYSLRGFRIRTLGPGSYRDTSTNNATAVIDRTGDIRLELSSEYRFDIIKLFSGSIKINGALFADAGNIWLVNSSNYQGGQFQFSTFINDIAIDAGVGLRLDVGFFVVRFDMGYPLKFPNGYNSTDGWVIKDLGLNKGVFNFAIGYPF